MRLLPAAGVTVNAPVEMSEGVETEVGESNLVADKVSVAKVRSESSERIPAVPAKVTLVAVNAESVMLPPDKVVYVAAPKIGVTKVGEVFTTKVVPVPV